MFERLIEKALEQVDNQVAQLKRAGLKPVSMIVLAGGGALSKYVIRRFQEHCQERLGGIMVRRDENSWSTVVRGGAVRGLESGMVVSRESKKAYGLVCTRSSMNPLTMRRTALCAQSLASGPEVVWTGFSAR